MVVEEEGEANQSIPVIEKARPVPLGRTNSAPNDVSKSNTQSVVGGDRRSSTRSQSPAVFDNSMAGSSSSSSSPSTSEAMAITMLLSDFSNYGLAERVTYHFDLIEPLDLPPEKEPPPPSSEPANNDTVSADQAMNYEKNNNAALSLSLQERTFSGVAALLDCVGVTAWRDLTKKRRRIFRTAIKDFNKQATDKRSIAAESQVPVCHEPRSLPLKCSPNTRMSFAYEITRIAFCVDASSTLTSSFGNGDADNNFCCALDRLPGMVRRFFKALVEPVTGSYVTSWKPILAVTVVAVYPHNTGKPETSVLVRDFRVHDISTANLLSNRIAQWALNDVEDEIASRMGHQGSIETPGDLGFNTASSSLRHLLDAGDVALGLLPFEARPCIVIATDCRSVSCDGVLDILADNERVDNPLFVLDLSNPTSHSPNISNSMIDKTDMSSLTNNRPNFLTWDPGGSSSFPLQFSDDSEALHAISKASGGCFFDFELLCETAKTKVGQVSNDSILHSDLYLSYKRRSLRPNALQWYILFMLSPLSPTLNGPFGKLAPPRYILQRQEFFKGRLDSFGSDNLTMDTLSKRTRFPIRTTFSSYMMSPLRIKDLLLARIKEGYRANRYGKNTKDPDKVSIQFILPLELDTVLHYELSYRASSVQTPMVGVANIKIELSGEISFINAVKKDFLSYAKQGRTISKKISYKLCKFLRSIRKDDVFQSYLCPVAGTFSSPDSPFLRRLATLDQVQRHRHFREQTFDVLCIGELPAGSSEGLLGDFMDVDNGEQALYGAISEWSTQTIIEERRYVKQTDCNRDHLTAYSIVEVTKSATTSRLFRVTLESFGGISAKDRLSLLMSLKKSIEGQKDVVVLPLLMDKYLAAYRHQDSPNFNFSWKQRLLENHYHYERWELVHDPEFLPLVTKRMTEIGNFWMLDSYDTGALFVKFVSGERSKNATRTIVASDLHLVQYQVEIGPEQIEIKIYMDSQREQFSPFRDQSLSDKDSDARSFFHKLVERVRARDKECGLALRSRTNLLSVFADREDADRDTQHQEKHVVSVERLLAYSSKEVRELRFFHPSSGIANEKLEQLTVELLLSQTFGVQVARLNIDCTETVLGVEPGIWFLIQYDRYTISIAHLQLAERQRTPEDGTPPFMYRALTFFTLGLGDLYYARDGIDEVLDIEDHISEYLCETEFANRVVELHGENYARSAYLALRSKSPSISMSLDKSDLEYSLKWCKFYEVANVFVLQNIKEGLPAGEGGSKESKLAAVIGKSWSAIAGTESCMFYHGEDQVSHDAFTDTGDITVISDDTTHASRDGEEYRDGEYVMVDSPETFEDASYNTDSRCQMHLVYPPLFAKFSLDGNFVSFNELMAWTSSATLTASVSVFTHMWTSDQQSDPVDLPRHHNAAIIELRSQLNSYVAEQKLERLRHVGSDISQLDLKVVKSCLRTAHSAISSTIPVEFFASKTDSMIPACAPAGREAEVEEGFSLFRKELQQNDIELKKVNLDSFFVVDRVADESTLSYWCFVNINMREGLISTKVYHPAGLEAATAVLYTLEKMIARTCHRVNQHLMLQSLHRSRLASSLLIPDRENQADLETGNPRTEFSTEIDTTFGCPIKFRTKFPLYHRLQASQVCQILEASVLHSLAVSNRHEFFVYRDEKEAIFYMKLNEIGGSTGDVVELLVFGVDEPGPSITTQLTRLLQKRVLTIAVDALSSVLMKNPKYSWKNSDVEFLKSFESTWNSLDDDQQLDDPVEREYELPESIFDPLLIMVYFRQNLCGSTYFHRLEEATTGEDISSETTSDIQYQIKDTGEKPNGISVDFDTHEFRFFYNASPSNLNPSFQPVCTLTEKGREYSTKSGTGVALIEVELIHSDGSVVKSLDAGSLPGQMESLLSVPVDSLRCKMCSSRDPTDEQDKKSAIRIRVRIINTSLSRQVLHDWIEMTLNQVTVAWATERHIERSHRRLLEPRHNHVKSTGTNADSWTGLDRKAKIDDLCLGLPAVMSIFESSYRLPHPAVQKLELSGMLQASFLAQQTLEMLESCIFGPLLGERRSDLSNLFIIRNSRSLTGPHLVNLVKETGRGGSVRVTKLDEKQSSFRDTPIDCPEYLCFYSFNYTNSRDDKCGKSSTPQVSSLLFREVLVDDANGDRKASTFTEKMSAIRKMNPSVFSRSQAFVLLVRRNYRSLITYNWNPQQLKTVTSRLKETDCSFLNRVGQTLNSKQSRCLGSMSPANTKTSDKNAGSNLTDAQAGQKQSANDEKKDSLKNSKNKDAIAKMDAGNDTRTNPGRPRKIKRPTFIRRPKLVGKSVEGAAMQAVAASRARASAGRLKGHSAPVSSTTSKTSKDKSLSRTTAPPKTNARSTESAQKGTQGKDSEIEPTPVSRVRDAQRAEVKIEDSVTSSLVRDCQSAEATLNSSRLLPRLVHVEKIMKAVSNWWTDSGCKLTPVSMDFILSQSFAVGSSVCRMMVLPPHASQLMMHSLGKTMAATADCHLLQLTQTQQLKNNEPQDTVYLSKELKKFHRFSYTLVIRLRLVKRGTEPIARCDTWIVALPNLANSKKMEKKRNFWSKLERNSAWIDQCTSLVHRDIVFEAQLLNFVGSYIDCHLLSPGKKDWVLPLLYSTMKRFPLKKQRQLRGLHYRVIETKLVPTSYQDEMIDLYSANDLLNYLKIGADAYDLVQCGHDGVCSAKEFVMEESRSHCFLTTCGASNTVLTMIILCHTGGRNLEEFTLREGSPYAVRSRDKVVVEGARVAKDALRSAALGIYRNSLWDVFSVMLPDTPHNLLSEENNFDELCKITCLTPLDYSNKELSNLLEDEDLKTDWTLCCSSMKEDPLFQPSWSFPPTTGSNFGLYIFFLKPDDVFLTFKVLQEGGRLLEGTIISKDTLESGDTRDRVERAQSFFVNFYLHYIWNGL